MRKDKNMLVQPMMRKLFLCEQLLLTGKAEKLVWQIHLALGGELAESKCQGVLQVERGDIRDWRSYEDAITYDRVLSREDYIRLWETEFPQEVRGYTFVTRASSDGSVSLTVADGVSNVLMSASRGEYMIPQVAEILQLVLAEILFAK